MEKLAKFSRNENGMRNQMRICFSHNGTRAYFGSWDGNMYAIDMISGEILWQYKTDNLIYTVPLVDEFGILF